MASYDNDDVPAYEPYEEKRGPDGHVRPITPGVTYIERPDDEWQTDAKGWWDRTDWNWTKEEKQAFADKYDDTVGTIEKVDENIKMCHRFGITLEEFEQSKKGKKHYDEFIAFLGEEDCVLDTIQLNGDCGIGAEGVERLMDCIVAKPSITSLNLMGAQMGVAGAKIIAERLVASGLTKLDISCDDIGDEGAVAIAEAWESGAKLTDLTLVNDEGPIKADGAKAVAKALATLQKAGTCCLENLCLSGNNIGVEGGIAIAEALGEYPKELDIKDNEVGDGAMQAFCDRLSTGETELTSSALHIHWNEIGTEGGIDFAEMLGTGESKLKEIYMCDNEIGPEAVRRFCKAIGKGDLEVLDLRGNPCSVECAKELAMCNHTSDKPLRHLELGLFAIDKEQLEAEERDPGAMFDVSAWFQDAFCSNVFCTDAQSILCEDCEDAFNPDKPPEEGQTVREAAPLPAVNSNKRRAASLKLAARLKAAVLQNAGKNALHADCARYCEAARDQICREGLGAWARLVPSGRRLTHADFQKVLGVLGVGPEGVENPRWCVRALAAAAEGSEARQDRERQLRALGIAGAALDRPDPHTGNTALLIAAAENAVGGRDAPLNQLVEFGADLLAKNKKGQTPLLVAAGKGHADAFRALAWCLERDGKLAEAAILTVTRDRASVLDLIVDRGDAPMLIEALGFADLRALVDLKTRGGDTPLIVAARRGRRDCAAALLDHGAKLEATNAQGHTALHTAAEHGRAPVLEELLARGALTDAVDARGRTARSRPQHLATRARPPPRRWGPREAPDRGREPAATSCAKEIIEISDDDDAAKVDGEVAGTPRKRRDDEVAGAKHLRALQRAEAQLARLARRAIAAVPGDAWNLVAGYGGVTVAVSLRCCSAQLRLGPNVFASVFADATRERFPAMALAVVAANGRESDHEAIYKSLHEAVASRLSPRPLLASLHAALVFGLYVSFDIEFAPVARPF
ncbi:extracellular ligand-gated ion channel [Aureococcus anophagefferens]|nr:extracellular ligand-gated ion channel [Aureococcus anophagefferens]